MAYTTINKSTDYFNTKLYTGNGSTQSITGVGFQPDWSWFKSKSSRSHAVFDSVRGTTKRLIPDAVNSESTNSGVTSFDSDGFTMGGSGSINANTETFVSWNWLASNTTASNTDGSITSTVSANTTAGFSIVSWTNSGSNVETIGHGLGVTPKMIIIKSRNKTAGWLTYHESIGNTKGLFLNTTGAEDDNIELFNDTSPTSSVFTTGITGLLTGGSNLIAYCFAEKKGFSKFGSYTGNGNADGSFVYTGFKPAFVMIKRTGGVQDWIILDNKRPGYNETNRALYPNASYDDAGTDKAIDTLSNGFKLRKNHEAINFSENYIYMAFAAAPLVGTNNVPCTAR
jgi:hypothetical protein